MPQKPLRSSGFNEELKYKNKDSEEKTRKEEKKKRRRKIIWFNPPFSVGMKTNIGELFFKMLKKHFPKSNPLAKVFNKNTIKISYSCTRNMKSITSSHNRRILTPKNEQVGCNCRIRTFSRQIINTSHRNLFIKLTSQTVLTTSISIIQDSQKQLSKNDIATKKVRLKLKIVKAVLNCPNMFGR